MSKESGDALRIGIEIKTEDLQELQSLIQEITEAQSSVRELTPLKGKSKGGSRSATAASSDEGFGIFSSSREGEAMPSKGRDKSSKQAFQRESEFDKIQNRIQEIEQANNAQIQVLSTMANQIGMGGIVGSMLQSKGGGLLNKKSGLIAGISPLSSGKLSGLSGLGNIIGVAGGFGFAASIALQAAQSVISWLQSPGNLLDARYKRIIKDELAGATEREARAEIRQGIRLLHVTPYGSFRGTGTSQAGQNARNMVIDLGDYHEMSAKGII